LEVTLLKSSSLKNNQYVFAPTSDSIKKTLDTISLGDTYPRPKQIEDYLAYVLFHHRKWISDIVDTADFEYSYITAGATEAINLWKLSETRPWQSLIGDYEWPHMVGGVGYKVTLDHLWSNKVLYISNPSAIDGNFLSDEDIDAIDAIGCPVILDCAYVGSTEIRQTRIPKNTEQIMFSFSKGWGLIGQRAGVVYSKKPHATLKHTQSFGCWNYATTELIDEIMERYPPDYLHELLIPYQLLVCQKYDLEPSDSCIIATSEDKYYIRRRRNGTKARLCITPLLEEL